MTPPDPARYAALAAEAIGATFEDLDEGRGYLYRITRNGRSVLGGSGAICAYPVNSSTAYTIARDKAHTKSILRAAGIPVAPGRLFFCRTLRAALRDPGRDAADARAYALELGYPVFCKPNMGALGNLAETIADPDAFADYLERLSVQHDAFLVEPVINADEYRVFVQDGRVRFAIQKPESRLTGDGQSTLKDLLSTLNDHAIAGGSSPLPLTVLKQTGRHPDDVLANGETLPLPARRNFHANTPWTGLTETPPAALADIALKSVQQLGLRIAAVDIFDRSEHRELTDLLVIEVNASPGLRAVETAGRMDLVMDIWQSMLNAALDTPPSVR